MKLGIVGSRQFTDVKLVARVIQKYVENYKDVIIVSGGCPDGADRIARDLAIEVGLPYHEFPPVHREHNEYCVLPPENYRKPYSVRNYFARNSQIAEHSDHVVAFLVSGLRCNGTMDTVTKARGLGRTVVLFER